MSTRGRDASCLALSFYFQYAEERGVPRRRLQEGLEVPPRHLDNRLAWVDYATFREIEARIGRTFPGEPDLYFELGRSVGATSLRFLRGAAGTVVSPAQIYLRIPFWVSTFFFPGIEIHYQRRDPRTLHGRYRLPPELSGEPFLQTIRGQLTALPTLVGAPEARVRLTRIGEHEVLCEVELPPTTLPGRLVEGASQLLTRIRLQGRAIDAATHELAETRRLLLENLDELQRRAEELERSNERLRAEAAERQRVELALRESEEQYRQLFDGAADLIAVVGTDGTLLELNARFEEESNYSRDEVIGRPFHETEILSPDSRVKALAMLGELVRTGSCPIFEATGIRKGGGTVPYELRAVPLRRGGRIVAVQAILRNLTERKQLEQQLAHAQRMESIGRLAGGLAHDFNNLLTVIKGNLSLALFSLPRDHRMRRALEDARDAGDRAATLTRQLLTFGRKGLIKPIPTDLNALCTTARPLLEGLLDEQTVLELVLDPGLGSARVDPAQLEQMLLNLVANARDAMPGGGRVRIATEVGFLGGQRLAVLTVEDTGTGMDAETQSHIFEPFFTTKPRDRGTGLGLSMVYGAVQQLGGSITVESELGRGSRFRLSFAEVAEAAVLIAVDGGSATELPRGTETILLVEDEDAVRITTRRLLEHLGYTVLDAASGAEAIVLAERLGERVALLLTDVVMPGMNGRELATRLRASRPGLRVLYTSGHTGSVLSRHGGLEEGTHFLAKPFAPAALARKLRELIDGS
jgi:PAS domain S-box-containing protein